MKKIVVCCAIAGTGKGSNTGMNTVDYAIRNLVREAGVEDKVEIQRPWPSYAPQYEGRLKDLDYDESDLVYNYFRVDESKTHALIYWGDFQHGFDYSEQTKVRISRHGESYGVNTETAHQLSDYLLLNKYYKKKLRPFKVGMYGVTLFQNGLNDYLKPEYYGNLKWLYEETLFAKSRESYSANTISLLKNDYSNNFMGVDCALLSTKEELLSLPEVNPTIFNHFENNIGCFFGRSTGKLSRLNTVRFINGLSKRTKKSVISIPWGYFSGGLLNNTLGRVSSLIKNQHKSPNEDFGFGDIFKGMSKLSLVITDTYHVAVNSIALGVPVICIYESSPKQKRNANMGYRYAWRDKRCLLFLNNQMADFLINSDDLKSSTLRKERIDNIANLLKNEGLIELAYNNLYAIAKKDRSMIVEQLRVLASEISE